MSRRTHVVRSAAVAALIPLALGSLAACGEDGDSSGGSTSLAKNAKSSEDSEPSGVEEPTEEPTDEPSPEESTAALEPGQPLDKDEFVEIYSAALEGATTAEISMLVKSQGQNVEAEGEVDLSTTPPAMDVEMSMGAQGKMEMRMVGQTMYMTIPGVAEGKFLKIDLNDPNNPFGSMGGQMDPRDQIDTFAKGLTAATYDGAEDVDGEEMDTYTVSVDSKEMMKASGMDKELLDLALQEAPPSMEYQIRIDEDGMFRAMEYDMGGALGSMSMSFDEWGTDVDIKAPGPGEVTEQSLADLMGGAGGGA
ncbi:DUF6612 family protein [Nocardioides pantholopis]|uniref:DUF6612 family protein n=1 Tax=Nocardioides pantholopis TaxID=2483798 RepID=UPI000F07A329|nr:DUF6612 family protein [Nocardioides pantholopis]